MGATTQTAASKRRGRPIVHPPADNDALKTRRERNREAQNVFRKRRQAAEAAQEKRLRRLEDVVEEMSSIFMRFADDMLGVELVTQNAGLVGCLRLSMSKILALAQEVVDPDDRVEAPSTELSAPDEEQKQSPASSDSAGPAAPDPTSSSNMVDTVGEIQTSYFPPVTTISTTSNSFISPPFPQLPPQVFGNGWPNFDILQPVKQYDLETNFTPVSFADNSFTLRLTETTIIIAYLLLTDSAADLNLAPGTAERMFSSTLRIRPRHLVTYKLRWLLGPGRPDMHLVSDVPFAAVMPLDGWPTNEKTGQVDIDAMTAAAGVHIDERWLSGKYLSAAGVYRQLVELGARMVGPDAMEINIPSRQGSPELDVFSMSSSTGSSGSSPPHEQQPESWSFVNFFPDFSGHFQPPASPTTITMRLSVSLLIKSLAEISVCLARGPGFLKEELGTAIESSVIGVHNAEGTGVY